MNPIFIVIPILIVLMYGLGLSLKFADFQTMFKKPAAIFIGLAGQLLILPAIAFAVAYIFALPALFYVGIILIACCPGGSSSNVFSKIAGGNVALSITLTALSSVITMFTIPVILQIALNHCSGYEAFAGLSKAMSPEAETATQSAQQGLTLPVSNLLMQNIVLMFIPILLGAATKRLWPIWATKADKLISKVAFPALMLLAAVFFIQHRRTIAENLFIVGAAVITLLLFSITASAILARLSKLKSRERKTIVIEVGMQNAAQAIAIASSPFIFNNSALAIPAIIYALMMNVVLLVYVSAVKPHNKTAIN